jgi:hypothetical protein
MSTFEEFLRRVTTFPCFQLLESTQRFACGDGAIIMKFSSNPVASSQDCVGALLAENPFPILSRITNAVRLTLEADQVGAEFTPAECLAILGQEAPSEKNFRTLEKSIREKAG